MFLASPRRGQGRGGGKLRSEPELGLGFRPALGSPSGSALAPLRGEHRPRRPRFLHGKEGKWNSSLKM